MTEHNKEKQNFKLITKPKALMQIAVITSAFYSKKYDNR
jgi:hypothetical protein